MQLRIKVNVMVYPGSMWAHVYSFWHASFWLAAQVYLPRGTRVARP